MLKYNPTNGDIEIKDAIPLLVEALYPTGNPKIAIKRVRQAISYGQKGSTKLPLLKGSVLPEKKFWDWAVKRWPELLARIEGIPLYVEVTGSFSGTYSIHTYDIDNPEELNILTESYLESRIQEGQRTGDDDTDLKQAYVLAEREVGKCRNEIDRIQKENDELKEKLEKRKLAYEEWKLSSGHRGI